MTPGRRPRAWRLRASLRSPAARTHRPPVIRVTSRASTCGSRRRCPEHCCNSPSNAATQVDEGCAAVHAGKRAGACGASRGRGARAPGAGDARQSRKGAPATGDRRRACAARAGAGVAAAKRGGSRRERRSSSPTSSCLRNSATRRWPPAIAIAARVAELNQQVQIANLPARSDEIAAATAEVKAATDALGAGAMARRAEVADGTDRRSRRGYALSARRMGRRRCAGRFVACRRQTSSFASTFRKPSSATVRIGDAVTVRCDGCGGDIPAKVRFIAPQAEFTPPVIYSRENRSNLVFLVEARPDVPESGPAPGAAGRSGASPPARGDGRPYRSRSNEARGRARHGHRRARADQALRRPRRRRQLFDSRRARNDLRLPRAPTAAARRRRSACCADC